MEMITLNSEDHLAEFLPHVESDAAAWMGIHINLTRLHEQLLGREGLSKQSLDKVMQVSLQMAGYLMEWGLKSCEGKLFVFGDSDLLCLLRHKVGLTDKVITRIKQEFLKSNLQHLLHFYDMQNRLSSIVALSTQKRETAEAYRLKQRAVSLADRLLEWGEPDTETTRLIQKKRARRGKGCILIVEDDILTRGMLTTLLKHNYQIVQAKDAREGIIYYIDSAPDMVFLDIHLPGISGNELLRRFKTLDPQAYVVMLSVDSVRDNITIAQRYGAAGFIRKPFPKEKVLEYVRQCPSLSTDPTTRALGWRKASPS